MKIKNLDKQLTNIQEKNEKEKRPEVIIKWRAKNGKWIIRTFKCTKLSIQEESLEDLAINIRSHTKQIWL